MEGKTGTGHVSINGIPSREEAQDKKKSSGGERNRNIRLRMKSISSGISLMPGEAGKELTLGGTKKVGKEAGYSNEGGRKILQAERVKAIQLTYTVGFSNRMKKGWSQGGGGEGAQSSEISGRDSFGW